MDVRVEPHRRLSADELMLLNYGAGEDSLKSPLDSNQSIWKEINPKYSGRTDAETEAPIFWPLDAKSWLTRKEKTLSIRKI